MLNGAEVEEKVRKPRKSFHSEDMLTSFMKSGAPSAGLTLCVEAVFSVLCGRVYLPQLSRPKH